MTWHKHDQDIHWLDADTMSVEDMIEKYVMKSDSNAICREIHARV